MLSTTTSTGHALAAGKIRPEDVLIYFPLDFPWIVRRALRLIRPKVLALVECELWPNLIRLAKKADVRLFLVNGRISDHSYRGYRRLRLFTRPLLQQVDLLCVQSEADRDRLGLPVFVKPARGGSSIGITKVEERYDRIRGLPQGRRLSCQTQILGDLVIDVPPESQVHKQVVRKEAA